MFEALLKSFVNLRRKGAFTQIIAWFVFLLVLGYIREGILIDAELYGPSWFDNILYYGVYAVIGAAIYFNIEAGKVVKAEREAEEVNKSE